MRVAILGGTGMEQIESFTVSRTHEPESDITLYEGELLGEPVLLLPRHGKDHQVPPHRIDHRQHLRVLRAEGVEAVLATAAAGSLRTDWGPGTLVVLSDFLDFTRQVYTLYDQEVVHTDFSEPFSTHLRQALIAAAMQEGIEVKPEGVYVCMPGPRYETAAEIRMFRSLGGDLIGMTAVPEAILFREAGIPYAAVATVTNLGTGLSERPLSHEEVTQIMGVVRSQIVALFARAIRLLRAGN